ncbi:MAG: serine/threonine protein phosphatase [Phenylobacterium sp.]|uniref:metallophosphoesterase family protein n=1 Tax=Phenylobacterium sp. TaxID=1871053 RepID=UPI0025EB56A0|nr:metallophosphoesterase family protein [Phenylobacterium sp.]MBI1197577.1 serine/threonine protein phosphatase [Phenylobacterium sp.]
MTGQRPSPKPPSTSGRLVYAVGDVHGHAEALAPLLDQIRRDAAEAAPAQRPLLIFLGDYVDRGPDSRGAVDLILAAEADAAFEVVALKGNHEDAMIRFLEEPGFAQAWIDNWGEATLRSYGVDPWGGEAVQARFGAILPDAHRAFLGRLRLSVTVGDYLFAHAGVRPGVALAEQAERDLMWIRYEFLHSDADFGKVVVHGHTPSEQPELKANRINVDTGVYFTGVLTAVRLEGADRRFLQARGAPSR